MASFGTTKVEIQKTVDAAAAFLNSSNGGFRKVLQLAKKAGLVDESSAAPFGVSRVTFDNAAKHSIRAEIPSEDKRAVARSIITAGSRKGVSVSPSRESRATLGLKMAA